MRLRHVRHRQGLPDDWLSSVGRGAGRFPEGTHVEAPMNQDAGDTVEVGCSALELRRREQSCVTPVVSDEPRKERAKGRILVAGI